MRRLLVALAVLASFIVAPGTASAASNCFTTNGDITAMTVMYLPQAKVVVAGNFTKITVAGKASTVKNLAVVDIDRCVLDFAGNVGNYPRSVAAANMRLYVGGDFGGVAYSLPSYQKAAWNPNAGSIWAIAFDGAKQVFIGTPKEARSTDPNTGAKLWSRAVSQGGVRCLYYRENEGWLYAMGLFKDGGSGQSGIVALQSNGVIIPSFKMDLRDNSYTGSQGSYDGENPISCGWNGRYGWMVLGTASAKGNYIRTVDEHTGREINSHQMEGDVQAVLVPGDGTYHLAGTHRGHGKSPENPCDTGYFGTRWPATSTGCDAVELGLYGNQSTDVDKAHCGICAFAYNRLNGESYVAGGFTGSFANLGRI